MGAEIATDSFLNLVGHPLLEAKLSKIFGLKEVADWLHVQGACRRLSGEEAELLDALVEQRI